MARSYVDCCQPYHQGTAIPETAEQLMRSRYSAFVLGNTEYLKATWHRDTLPADLDLESQQNVRWLGLQVKQYSVLDAAHASVEFVARYKINGRAFRLHEISRFVREHDRWFYVDGKIDDQ